MKDVMGTQDIMRRDKQILPTAPRSIQALELDHTQWVHLLCFMHKFGYTLKIISRALNQNYLMPSAHT